MVEPIAKPIGLFKAGPSGIGGQYEPMTPAGIRHDLFQLLPEGIAYGLAINAGPNAPTSESMIIDVIYDRYFTLHDPHRDFAIEQVTDYPIDQATRGLVWFCAAPVPRYTRYSKIGKHTITIRVAPRTAPEPGTTGSTQTLGPRDFSPASGGVEATFEFTIYPDNGPAIPDDE